MKTKKIKPSRFINSKVIATISISLVLSLLGLIILLVLSANDLSTKYKESLFFEVFMYEDTSDEDILRVQSHINKAPYSHSTLLITKEDALEYMKKELGTDPLELTGYNPFPASIKVELNTDYSNTDSIAVIEKSLSSFPKQIKHIEFQKELMQFVNENIKKIAFILFSLAALLLLISYALINNTIRLMIYSKRFIIHTMKLVGAKNSFIRSPFIWSNIIMGILAAFLGMTLIIVFLSYIKMPINEINLYTSLITAGSMLVLGIIIPMLATWFGVNKYLKMRNNDLYYI